MVRTNQGGSILSFIVVGVVLAGLLVGGVYAVRHYQPGNADATSAPVVPSAPATSDKGADTAPAPAAPEEADTNNDETTTPETPAAPAPSDDMHSDVGTSGSTENSATDSGDNVASLPQTGPVETMSSVVGAGLLVAAGLAYVSSRRQLANL